MKRQNSWSRLPANQPAFPNREGSLRTAVLAVTAVVGVALGGREVAASEAPSPPVTCDLPQEFSTDADWDRAFGEVQARLPPKAVDSVVEVFYTIAAAGAHCAFSTIAAAGVFDVFCTQAF